MNSRVDKHKHFAIIKENGTKNSMSSNDTLKTNGSMGSCDVPSEVTKEDLEKEGLYVPGNIVWAMFNKQWWPGFVEDDPDRNEYCWIESGEEYYNVTFFGDKVSRSKIAARKMQPFSDDPESIQKKVGHSKSKRLWSSIEKALDAYKLSTAERLEKYSFVVLYNGYIGPVSDDDDLPSVSSKSNGIGPYKRKDRDSDSSSLPPKVKKSRSSNKGRRSPADSDVMSLDGDSVDGRCCVHCKARITAPPTPEPAPIARPPTSDASTMTDPPSQQDASTLIQDNVLEERLRAMAAEHRAILAALPEQPDNLEQFLLHELHDEEESEEEPEEEHEEEEEERRCVTPIEQIRAYNAAVREDQCAIFSDYVKY